MFKESLSLSKLILSLIVAATITLGLCYLKERVEKKRAAERVPMSMARAF